MFYFVKRSALLLICLLLAVGCASTPVIKPDFMGADQSVNKDRIRHAAQSSQDIHSFVSQVYEKKLGGDAHETTVDSVDSSSTTPNYDAVVAFMGVKTGTLPLRTHVYVFKTYCESKNGALNRWFFTRDDHAFTRIRGMSREFITCELKNQVAASLVFEVYAGSQKPNLPYITKTTFIDGIRFAEYMESNRLFGYQSSNGMITVPANVIIDPNSRVQVSSTRYAYFFNYRNNDSAPREINMLNSSVQLQGREYAVDYTYSREPIKWTSYEWGEKNVGVFTGEEGKKLTKLRFNPGQEMRGHVLFNIPGVTSLNEGDMASFVFNLDGNKAQIFKKTTYYDLFKSPLKQ